MISDGNGFEVQKWKPLLNKRNSRSSENFDCQTVEYASNPKGECTKKYDCKKDCHTVNKLECTTSEKLTCSTKMKKKCSVVKKTICPNTRYKRSSETLSRHSILINSTVKKIVLKL